MPFLNTTVLQHLLVVVSYAIFAQTVYSTTASFACKLRLFDQR